MKRIELRISISFIFILILSLESSGSTELLKSNLKTMPLAQCNETFWKYNEKRNLAALRNGLDESQYCAYDPTGQKGSCQGDSGGLLQTTETILNPAKLVGVVSFGIGCGGHVPRIYTRVAHYIDWIGEYVWPNNEISTPRINITDDEKHAHEDVYVFPTK